MGNSTIPLQVAKLAMDKCRLGTGWFNQGSASLQAAQRWLTQPAVLLPYTSCSASWPGYNITAPGWWLCFAAKPLPLPPARSVGKNGKQKSAITSAPSDNSLCFRHAPPPSQVLQLTEVPCAALAHIHTPSHRGRQMPPHPSCHVYLRRTTMLNTGGHGSLP